MFEFLNDWSPEAMMVATLLSLMVVVMVVVGMICIQAGLFHSIHIGTKEPEFGELFVMYKCGRGAYSESGSLYTESHSLLPEYDCIGVYYDDPEKQKSSENLRYIVGLVLAENGSEANEEHVSLMEQKGYKKALFPKVKYAVTTDFPYANTLSCVFAVFRVYPALREYVERRELCAHPFIELYHNSSKRILFCGPLEQQDSFYVPEVLEDPYLSSPCEDSCDDEDDSARVDDSDSDKDDCSAKTDSVNEKESGNANWDNSASLVNDGADESDTNTASSFEEIDPSETANLPTDPQPSAPEEVASQPPKEEPVVSEEQKDTESPPLPTKTETDTSSEVQAASVDAAVE